jgi:hypothetical protein
MMPDSIRTGDIQGAGIPIGTIIYGDINYPITLQAPLRAVFDPLIEDRVCLFGRGLSALESVR